MKQFSLIISVLFAFVCGNGILKAAPLTAAADTLDHYAINGQPVSRFDGSQLVGRKIVSYEISLINHPTKGPIRIHEIRTEGISVRSTSAAGSDEPVYVIDGKKATKKQFERLNPAAVKSITVVKNGSQEEVKQYPGWENGVILVETKEVEPQKKDTKVNIGYGEADSRDLSYSVASVKPEETEFYSNMYDYLRGKVAGVQVTNDNTIIIRGVTTFHSATAPLILVDGVEITDLNTIDPHDVYSVDVLKDASSAIYGLKGANGVILITTKVGQQAQKQGTAKSQVK